MAKLTTLLLLIYKKAIKATKLDNIVEESTPQEITSDVMPFFRFGIIPEENRTYTMFDEFYVKFQPQKLSNHEHNEINITALLYLKNIEKNIDNGIIDASVSKWFLRMFEKTLLEKVGCTYDINSETKCLKNCFKICQSNIADEELVQHISKETCSEYLLWTFIVSLQDQVRQTLIKFNAGKQNVDIEQTQDKYKTDDKNSTEKYDKVIDMLLVRLKRYLLLNASEPIKEKEFYKILVKARRDERETLETKYINNRQCALNSDICNTKNAKISVNYNACEFIPSDNCIDNSSNEWRDKSKGNKLPVDEVKNKTQQLFEKNKKLVYPKISPKPAHLKSASLKIFGKQNATDKPSRSFNAIQNAKTSSAIPSTKNATFGETKSNDDPLSHVQKTQSTSNFALQDRQQLDKNESKPLISKKIGVIANEVPNENTKTTSKPEINNDNIVNYDSNVKKSSLDDPSTALETIDNYKKDTKTKPQNIKTSFIKELSEQLLNKNTDEANICEPRGNLKQLNAPITVVANDVTKKSEKDNDTLSDKENKKLSMSNVFAELLNHKKFSNYSKSFKKDEFKTPQHNMDSTNKINEDHKLLNEISEDFPNDHNEGGKIVKVKEYTSNEKQKSNTECLQSLKHPSMPKQVEKLIVSPNEIVKLKSILKCTKNENLLHHTKPISSIIEGQANINENTKSLEKTSLLNNNQIDSHIKTPNKQDFINEMLFVPVNSVESHSCQNMYDFGNKGENIDCKKDVYINYKETKKSKEDNIENSKQNKHYYEIKPLDNLDNTSEPETNTRVRPLNNSNNLKLLQNKKSKDSLEFKQRLENIVSNQNSGIKHKVPAKKLTYTETNDHNKSKQYIAEINQNHPETSRINMILANPNDIHEPNNPIKPSTYEQEDKLLNKKEFLDKLNGIIKKQKIDKDKKQKDIVLETKACTVQSDVIINSPIVYQNAEDPNINEHVGESSVKDVTENAFDNPIEIVFDDSVESVFVNAHNDEKNDNIIYNSNTYESNDENAARNSKENLDQNVNEYTKEELDESHNMLNDEKSIKNKFVKCLKFFKTKKKEEKK